MKKPWGKQKKNPHENGAPSVDGTFPCRFPGKKTRFFTQMRRMGLDYLPTLREKWPHEHPGKWLYVGKYSHPMDGASLGGGFKYFWNFHPYLGKMYPF